MQEALFVWLGAKRAQKRGVDEKGILLDLAMRAGLPVPAGGILLDDFYRLAVGDELLVVENGRFHIPDPQLLHDVVYEEVRFPRIDKAVTVRAVSAKAAPQFDVDFNDVAQLAETLATMYTALIEQPEAVRRDLMVMESVQIVRQGTAVLPAKSDDDEIHYKDETLVLSRLRGWQSPDKALPDAVKRVQKLARGVRRSLFDEGWQFDWADDGRDCWLLRLSGIEKGS